MNPIWAFIKTTRPINLLIIVATMYAMRYFVAGGYIHSLLPEHVVPGVHVSMYQISDLYFVLLTLIMVFLAASGNIINDYFDVKVDRINKPERITIDRGLKRRVAMAAHHSLNIIAVLMGIYLGWAEQLWFYAFVPLCIASALWFYSFYLKKTFLLGNILVALVVSIVPIWATYSILVIPLPQDLDTELAVSFPYEQQYLLMAVIVMGYAIQAYMISLFREIIKDAEDIKGDSEFNYRTLPIVWGWEKTRVVLALGMFFWLAVLMYTGYYMITLSHPLWGWSFLMLVALPFILALLSLRGKELKKAHFTRASLWLKITLGGGLLFSAFIPEFMEHFAIQLIN